MQIKKAGNETRTHDPFITSEVLYRLSYSSLWNDKCIKIYTLIRHKDILSYKQPFVKKILGKNSDLSWVKILIIRF